MSVRTTKVKRWHKYSSENQPKAWLYMLPALIIIGIFNVYPLIMSFYKSFFNKSITNPQFLGIQNYLRVLNDPTFHTALKNTATYAFVVVPVALLISLLIALLIFDKIKFKKFFEAIFFIPYLTSTIAIGVVFRFLLNGHYGIINHILGFVGIGPIEFLENIQMSMPTIILFGIWSSLAFNIIILLAGLRNINQEYYKVADMFGATKVQQFFKITLPQLIPTLSFLLTVNFISAFKVYTQVYAIFNGRAGLADSAQTAVFYIFDKFHVRQDYGLAMAATVILFIIILILTLIQNKITKKFED